jgi:hypothetical protein
LKGANGQPVPVKIQVFPMGRNLLFLRLENIADLFDYQSTQTLTDTGVYVDVPQLAKNFFY